MSGRMSIRTAIYICMCPIGAFTDQEKVLQTFLSAVRSNPMCPTELTVSTFSPKVAGCQTLPQLSPFHTLLPYSKHPLTLSPFLWDTIRDLLAIDKHN